MTPVARNEILGLAEYEQIRDVFRRRVIEQKQRRRVAIGNNMSVLFENRDTVLFQIQEMLRAERITREDAILHELETYNELVPGEHELSATIFVEYSDAAERDRMLVALAGLEDRFYLEVDGERLTARNETRGTRADRTTAVHYVKFPLSDAAEARLREGSAVSVRLGTAHPAYDQSAALPESTLAELRADLNG